MMRVMRLLEIINNGCPEKIRVSAPSLSLAVNPIVLPLASFARELKRVRGNMASIDLIERRWILLPHAENVAEAFHGSMSLCEAMNAAPTVRNDLAFVALRVLNSCTSAIKEVAHDDWKPSPHLESFCELVRAADIKNKSKERKS